MLNLRFPYTKFFYTLFFSLFLFSCGDEIELLPPKPNLPQDDTVESKDSSNDENINTTTEVLNETEVELDVTPYQTFSSGSNYNDPIIKLEQKSETEQKTQTTPIPVATVNPKEVEGEVIVMTAEEYKKPFLSSPDPSTYKELMGIHMALQPEDRAFINEMTVVMTGAKHDIDRAKDAFEKLKMCALALPSQEIFTVRATCAENLRTIAKLYPEEFTTKYAEIEKQFPQDIKSSMFI